MEITLIEIEVNSITIYIDAMTQTTQKLNPKVGEVYEYEKNRFILIDKIEWEKTSLFLYGTSISYNTDEDIYTQFGLSIAVENKVVCIREKEMKNVHKTNKISKREFTMFLNFAKRHLTAEQYEEMFESFYY